MDTRRSERAMLIVFILSFSVTMILGTFCDEERCKAECKFRLQKDHGRCEMTLGHPVIKRHLSCYCYQTKDSWYGERADIEWCRLHQPDLRCVTLFDPEQVDCDDKHCSRQCRRQYERSGWEAVRGACEPYYCKCYGKKDPWWKIFSRGKEQALN